MFTDVPDIRLKIPSSAEEVVALRDALIGTIHQARTVLGEFAPVLYEPHSYAWQVENVQKQFGEKYEALKPGQGKEPTLVHLTFWPGGIQDWRLGRFWDGSAEYLVEEDGTVGSRYSLESTPEEASDEDLAGEYLVDAGGNRIEA